MVAICSVIDSRADRRLQRRAKLPNELQEILHGPHSQSVGPSELRSMSGVALTNCSDIVQRSCTVDPSDTVNPLTSSVVIRVQL